MANITKKYYDNRKSPYVVIWTHEGRRISRFFETEQARDIFIKSYSFLENDSFEAIMSLGNETVSEIALIEKEREEVSFKEIWQFWKKHHKATKVIKTWDACNNYIKDMRINVKASEEHIRHVIRILENFCETFAHCRFIATHRACRT